jgi:hypothetical protein
MPSPDTSSGHQPLLDIRKIFLGQEDRLAFHPIRIAIGDELRIEDAPYRGMKRGAT